MNISPFTIYLWQLADQLRDGATVIFALSGLAAILSLIFCTFPDENIAKFARSKIKLSFLAIMLFGGLKIFTPSSNTIAMMVVIPKIADSKVIQQDLPDLYNAAVAELKKAIRKAE